MSDAKIAIVVRDDLAISQTLNATAFPMRGIVGAAPKIIGETHRDADGNTYPSLCVQPSGVRWAWRIWPEDRPPSRQDWVRSTTTPSSGSTMASCWTRTTWCISPIPMRHACDKPTCASTQARCGSRPRALWPAPS
ncbi:MAG: DUF2000 family protein [Burkholderiales bacterium]|nr:DUF2000 family protein [Burkholderiales bacterium]